MNIFTVFSKESGHFPLFVAPCSVFLWRYLGLYLYFELWCFWGSKRLHLVSFLQTDYILPLFHCLFHSSGARTSLTIKAVASNSVLVDVVVVLDSFTSCVSFSSIWAETSSCVILFLRSCSDVHLGEERMSCQKSLEESFSFKRNINEWSEEASEG